MAMMGRYCKAFAAKRFMEFAAWRPSNTTYETTRETPEYLFLHEDLRVTAGIFTDEQIIFNEITPEWESFCHNVLCFTVPTEVLE